MVLVYFIGWLWHPSQSCRGPGRRWEASSPYTEAPLSRREETGTNLWSCSIWNGVVALMAFARTRPLELMNNFKLKWIVMNKLLCLVPTISFDSRNLLDEKNQWQTCNVLSVCSFYYTIQLAPCWKIGISKTTGTTPPISTPDAINALKLFWFW